MALPTHINALIENLWLKNGKMKDNFFKGTPLLDLMNKNKISHKRGNKLRQRVELGEGAQFKFVSELEVLDRVKPDFASYAEWDWKFANTSVVVTLEELLRADTKADMIDLVDTIMQNALKTGKEAFAQQLMLSTGTGAYAKSVEGFAVKFAAGTTAAGGITSTLAATWAPQRHTGTVALATPTAGLITTIKNHLLDSVEDNASVGAMPDAIVTTRAIFNKLHEYALGANNLIKTTPVSKNGMYLASLGYKTIELNDVPVIVDRSVPDHTMYAFNTENLQLCVHPDANFTPVPGDDGKPQKLHKLDDQNAYAMDLFLMTQLLVAERRALSVMTAVTTA